MQEQRSYESVSFTYSTFFTVISEYPGPMGVPVRVLILCRKPRLVENKEEGQFKSCDVANLVAVAILLMRKFRSCFVPLDMDGLLAPTTRYHPVLQDRK